MSRQLTGNAYAFINCRSSKSDVGFFAKDIKDFMSEDLKAQGYGPMLDRLRLDVNQGLTCLKQRGMRRFEARAELLKTVMAAEKEGMVFTRPGGYGDLYVIHAALADAPNLQVADELAAIVNNMYSATPLYAEGEPFRGIITYLDRDSGAYLLRQ